MMRVGVLVLALCVVLSLPLTLRWFSPLGVLAGATLGALCVLPQRLASVATAPSLDVAHGSPNVSTYGIATVGIGAVALRRHGARVVPWPLGLLAVLLLVGAVAVWPRDLLTAAGVQQYLLVLPALAGGTLLGAALVSDGPSRDLRLPRTLALCCTLVVSVQLVVAAAQRAGLPVFELGAETAALMGDRVNGTLGHPNSLGKVVLLLLVLAVPLTRYPDPITRRLAGATVVLSLPLLGLAGGRANLLAAVGFLGLWAVTLPGGAGTRRYRLLLLAGVAVLTAPFAAGVMARFRQDPRGGSRGALNEQALKELPEHWLLGVGPNRYVTDISMNPNSGHGLPVHNTFLLALLELGLVGAVLLLSVWVLGILRRVGVAQAGPVGDDFSRALLVSAPALVLVAMTGWGLLATSTLPLWFLVVGVCLAAAPRTRERTSARRPPGQVPELAAARGPGPGPARH